ncbi:thiosulfate oxidation carrier protein SoxY [Malaciobacter canalis]|jgi:sulfur-oxidizing protein SoxY|uniref:Sulfur-oxidizing protein SoxY n=2 Tax=Malaciobacter TaxID=2321114 RepID=A0AB36ZX93_9BACT|nr:MULTISPECIES: thiosulfate oxidation carrier protein SoxY [Malaciobacter]PHO09223.1 thiosulfate oxidation carrier protein SoxY [Malaciobacter canalis]PPK62325.1 sulfur-oxidizing protein SoxY [Malaciobacter marinus]QEE32210.1 sulfur oxidation protein SoxYZ, sulfur covalently binding protein [Malaciobacter canalis]
MLERRNFLGLSVLAFGVAAAPLNLSAINFRETKPNLWKATKVDDAIKELFGTTSATEGKIKLKAPDIAENGAVIPVSFETDLKASKVAVFQDANPESAVAVFDIPDNAIIDYGIRIKMAETGTVTVVAQENGKLYKVSKLVKVTIGGCGG